MSLLRRTLGAPLLHFMILGGGLLVLAGLVGDDRDEREVVMTAAQIEGVAQSFRSTWRRPPTAAELDGLIAEAVREEILYREALALGLDQGDTVIRRRLRQKMEFISEDLASQQPSDDDLTRFLADHPDRFRGPARISFAQVYLNPERRGPDLWADAEQLLTALTAGRYANPADAGDPFLLEHAYEAVTDGDLERLFGPGFAAGLVDLPPGQWSGPVESGYGLHLVRIRERRAATLPELDQVRDAVANEWLAARRAEIKDRFYRELLARYRVIIDRPAEALPQPE